MKAAIPCLLAGLALAGGAKPVLAQGPSGGATARPGDRAEVLVLGVYHMANPGRDVFNMKADDVLAPKRQAEIADLIEVLKRFRPTKVAVERDVFDGQIAKDYAAYLAGAHELTRNEIEQVGFRLARELGHKAVYPADVDGEFPLPRVVSFAKASGRTRELDAMMADTAAAVKAQGEYLASHTVLETLLYMNAEAKVAEDVGGYYRMAHLGEPGDWAGADLLADWFRRNARIYGNLARLADAPGERVLAIFGAGHLGWLRQDVASDPTLKLRTLAEIAEMR
jgi:hypothetical protein